MGDGMLWCHVCKAMAFPKTGFGTVAALDCGHVVKRDKGSGTVDKTHDAEIEKRIASDRASRKKVKHEAARAAKPKTIDIPPPLEPHPWRRAYTPGKSVSGTGNIARGIIDFIDGGKKP